jgi:hypothetical protein
MSNFWWVMAAVVIFVLGQWLMIRPSPYEQKLLKLRESARQLGLLPRLAPQPDWLKTERKQLIACYSVIIPTAKLGYFRAERQADGRWRTAAGVDYLAGVSVPDEAQFLLAVEGQANSLAFFWREEAGPEVLAPLKTWLEALANSQTVG